MRAKLISRETGEFAFSEQATIGRAAGSTVRLEASVISSQHARISFDPERSAYILEDLGSLNGTELDGASIDRKEVLGKLHLVRFGGSEEFIFQLVSAEAGSPSPDSPSASDTPGAEAPGAPPGGRTQVGGEIPVLPEALREPASGSEAQSSAATGAGDGAGKDDETEGTRVEKDVVPLPEVLAQASAAVAARVAPSTAARTELALEIELDEGPVRFALREGNNVVGRSKTAAIRLDLPDLSRRHATLTVAGGKVRVRDEGSRNHTYIDGDQIDRETVAPIGAQIVFGRVMATLVEAPAESQGEPPPAETGTGEPDTKRGAKRAAKRSND